ncbi:hypothetical protein SBBP2_2370005 [Burkholderiales bacterium]|nr:hypothetical protein SBBP2_2370005 [Burkholderiales bacterium]
MGRRGGDRGWCRAASFWKQEELVAPLATGECALAALAFLVHSRNPSSLCPARPAVRCLG